MENVISQRPHVSALVRSTSNASRLDRLEIDVVRSHLSDKIMTTTRAQQKAGVCAKGFPLGRSPRHHRMAYREGRVVTTSTIRAEIWNARS